MHCVWKQVDKSQSFDTQRVTYMAYLTVDTMQVQLNKVATESLVPYFGNKAKLWTRTFYQARYEQID